MDKAFTLWYKSSISDKELEMLLDNGYNTTEISIDYPWPFTDKFHEITNKIIDHGFHIQVHYPWRDISILSPYKSIREASIQVIEEVTAHIYDKYEIRMTVLHLDTRNTLGYNDVDTITRSLERLSKIQQEYSIPILIETLPNPVTGVPTTIKEISQRLGLGICFDPPHILSREIAKKKKEIQSSYQIIDKWIETLKEKIRLLHLHGIMIKDSHSTVHVTLEDQADIYVNLIKKLQNYNQNIGITIEVFHDKNGYPATAKVLIEQLKLLNKYL